MICTGGLIQAGSGVTLMARVLGTGARPVTQASLASIAYTVTDLTAGAALASGTFPAASSVFDAPVTTDPRWRYDSPARPGPDGLSGYNFLGTLPASTFAPSAPGVTTARRIQVDVAFTPVSGEPFRQVFTFMLGRVYG